ncbi:CREB/ATF bZIP transcription factor isoform X3 [Sardina pilchardus]|uniref:CREB/ATF bZIP transcription factor isoform X3 n=1 Tax=Sardina pilchardus TaxID=27697 RepID=UPI002E0E678B
MTMVTRKRGRSSNSSCPSMGVQLYSPDVTDDVKPSFVETDTHRDILFEDSSSPSEDLELFGLEDFSWVLDKDALPSLGDIDTLCELKDDDDSTDQHFSVGGQNSQRKSTLDVSSRGMNKNAIAARINRLKKKEYVGGLEKKVGLLTTENQILKQENGHLNKRVEELENETRYLRAVLANDSMLGQLLSRLSGVNGMKFSTSLFQGSETNDHDYAIPKKRVKAEEGQTSGGVCLHVDKDHVSVEFCTKCAESASAALKIFSLGGCLLPRMRGYLGSVIAVKR